MAVAAFAGLIGFASVAFGWREWMQRRRTGKTGLRGSLRMFPGVLGLLAGIAAVTAGLFLDIVDAVNPLAPMVHPFVQTIGVFAFGAGFVLTVRAQHDMGASWRVGIDTTETTALVTSGVFHYVRNPIFTGMILVFVGVTLLVPNVVTVAGTALLVTGLELYVRLVEEPYLAGTHGDAYRSYVSKAGRFVPRLGRAK